MLGTVVATGDVRGGPLLSVRLDNDRDIVISEDSYRNVDHGYAATIHKSQGATVDRTFVLATGMMDQHLTYVSMTRHRDQTTLYAARFMTITCRVHDAWRARIPAVVHVDGTARPQVIERSQNRLYYDILAAYKARTGIPVLVNTSFNVHEEPIVNGPDECAQALAEGRIDYVVTAEAVYGPAPKS